MSKTLNNLKKAEQKKLKKSDFPEFLSPMLAKLEHDPFFETGWIYGRKWDGERVVAYKKGKQVTLKSRNNKILNTSYPEIEEVVREIDTDNIILDGEMVAFSGQVSDFSRLQERMHVRSKKEAKKSKVKVYYYVFDVLYLDQYALKELPLTERKKILETELKESRYIHLSEYKKENGESYYQHACRSGWEGLIAKKADSRYQHKRSGDWLKFKCAGGQELVIGGYTDPKGSRTGFGALLLGYYQNGKFRYAGKVGTGFDKALLSKLHKELGKRRSQENPYATREMEGKDVHFVKPELVCEIGFTEWTHDNRLRHPRFIGLRRDKNAKDITKEA
jgi:DNA ligase D-like protein (predicted ligase)